MCFGDKKERSTSPPPRPVAQAPAPPAPMVLPLRPAQSAKLTKPRPQAQAQAQASVQPSPASEKSSMEITWPLDRPIDDEPPRVFAPLPPAIYSPAPAPAIYSPRPFRYDENSVPPSNAPSLYSLSDPSQPTTPAEESLFDFHSPPFECPPSPPPICPPTPSSMGESVRMASLMPAPLVAAPPQFTPQRMRRGPNPPLAPINIPAPPMPAVPRHLPRNTSPDFKNESPTRRHGSPSSKSSSPTSKSSKSSRSSSGPRTPTTPNRSFILSSSKKPRGPQPASERVAAAALQRARSLSSTMRPKFSLPETLAPFSLAPPPIVMDLYEPPSPARLSPTRMAPAVPLRTAPMEKVVSPGRIAVVDEDMLEPDMPEAAAIAAEMGYERIRLFPIPDSIIRGEERYQAERRRRQHREGSSRSSNEGSRSSQSSSSQDFDSRCPSPASIRPASVTLGQLPSRFSMSSLGSTLRVHQDQTSHNGHHQRVGRELQRPASARPSAGSGAGSIPTFPSRHEAKKARKLWLAEQEEAKRQSAKMGVEGILGWDATTRRWVNKMTDEEKEAWLNQWKEKRSAHQALHRGSSAAQAYAKRPSRDWHVRPMVI